MKYLYLLIAGNLLAISALFAQNTSFEATIRNDFFSYGEYILAMDNGENIIAGKDYISGGWGSEVLRLDKVDASGNLLWSNTYPTLTHYEAYYLIATKGTDNTFFIYGHRGGCDTGTWQGGERIMKFDVEGNLLWTRTDDDLGVSFSHPLRIGNNGKVWAKSAEMLIELDNSGNISQTVAVDSVSTYDYDPSTGDFVALRGHYPNRKLQYIEASGNTYEIPSTIGLADFLDNGTIAFLTNDILNIYDNQLNLIDSLIISGFLNGRTQLTSDNQYIYILKTDSWADSFILLKLDYSLNILDEFVSPIRINHIDLADDYIRMVGYEYTHTWVQNISNNFDDTYADTDIGVANILVNAADSTCTEFFFYCNCDFEAKGVRVVVENFGTEIIDYYELNSLHNCLNDCYDPQVKMVAYDNRNLLPGQVDTVDFPDFNLLGYDDTRFCLYTTRPNKLTDKNHDNDEICRDFSADGTVNTNEVGEPEPFLIFPNPTTGILDIKGISTGEYGIFNVAGQIMQVGELKDNTSINISIFPQGIYFISIMVDNKQVVRRLVKM